jgi:outer membrane protein assembly factor BamB
MHRRKFQWVLVATSALVLTSACTSIGVTTSAHSNGPAHSNVPARSNSATTDFQNAVAFQMTPGHSGYSPDKVGPTWKQAWSRNLDSPLSYPLIVGGNVYVIGLNSLPSQESTGSTLFSINANTGHMNWQASIPSGSGTDYGNTPASGAGNTPGLAYLNGDLFTVVSNAMSDSGTMSAYNASTGAVMWSAQLADQWSFNPPTALNGMVYTSGSGDSATEYAVNAATGTVVWQTKLGDGGTFSIPAVSPSGVYLSYPGQEIYALNPSTGTGIWQHSNGDNGGGGATPALVGNYLLTQDQLMGNLVLDATTGRVIGSFKSGPTPAASGNVMFAENSGLLQAQAIPNGSVKWSFHGDGRLDTSPIVVNNTVYEGSSSGMLYAVNSSTGAEQWRAVLPAGITGNIAEGDGYLAVPASNVLTVFRPTP